MTTYTVKRQLRFHRNPDGSAQLAVVFAPGRSPRLYSSPLRVPVEPPPGATGRDLVLPAQLLTEMAALADELRRRTEVENRGRPSDAAIKFIGTYEDADGESWGAEMTADGACTFLGPDGRPRPARPDGERKGDPVAESFRIGMNEALAGDTRPVETLWDDLSWPFRSPFSSSD